jgi:hypothetical protein
LLPLPPRFKQADARTHRNVQTFHAAQHRDVHQFKVLMAFKTSRSNIFLAIKKRADNSPLLNKEKLN